ncbi:hypothetical protein [Saccharothrix obliqua]|uniref:hypothetical protein n=1 Tax=Saccharothrix obliqua TaxID=2861747 RepID=UPI001C5DB4F1|nr:hypothetical protein [Saccharothrix obliqua]MBW4717153.1 hypothetical protein [Saccharothrix obliqua]
MRYLIASMAIAALTLPGGVGAALFTTRHASPPEANRWEHIATYHDEPLCTSTGRSGVESGAWAEYAAVFNEDYGAWDLHVLLIGS